MGRGGRSAHGPGGASVAALAQHVIADSPLVDRPTAELKKHAEQRGLKNDGTREGLLVALHPFSKVRAAGTLLLRPTGTLVLFAMCRCLVIEQYEPRIKQLGWSSRYRLVGCSENVSVVHMIRRDYVIIANAHDERDAGLARGDEAI